MHRIKTFGFKRVIINNAAIYTCNIITNRLQNHPVIQGVDVFDSSKLLKSGVTKETTTISYTTLENSLHHFMQREIMLFLEQHAHDRVTSKYSYLHQENYSISMQPDFDF